jgi:TolB-like protein/Tfp pilus assembly protein PilF
MVVGFPIVLVFAWAYEITPEGLKPTEAVSPKHSIRHQTGKRLDRAIIAVLAIALTYFVIDKFWLTKHAVPATTHSTAEVKATPAVAAVPEKSVAVLPFLDMSEKQDEGYFSDGLSEELIDMLTKVPDLRVPARTSSFYFKGKQSTIKDIAAALRVAHVLEGSVRKSGKTLRITAQLIHVESGYHVWSETFDRRIDDIFKIQDEIAGAVVKALKVSLLRAEGTRAAPTASSEAYTLYLQARLLTLRGTVADAAAAADYLQRAIQLDPKFAPAWARLTQVRTFQYELGALPFDKALGEAREAAQQAIKLDPALAAAHLSLARVHFFEWDWGPAQIEIQRARQLDPRDADALRWAATIPLKMGRAIEAIGLIQQAVELDPLDGSNYAILGSTNFTIGNYAEAELAFRKAIELAPPEGFGSRDRLPVLMLATGQPMAALASCEQIHDEDDREWGKALSYFALGRDADSDAALAVLETSFSNTDAYPIAEIHAYRGETDKAFVWLERAYSQHTSDLTAVREDWLLTKLRGDPRYKVFLRKMKFAE